MRREMGLFAPAIVEELGSVERYESGKKALKRAVRVRLHRKICATPAIVEVVRAQRKPRDYAERSSAAALERPEKLRIAARVDRLNLAVRRHYLSLKQPRRGRAVMLGEATEPAARNQAGDANGRTAATLNVASAFGGYGVVGRKPDRASLHANGRHRLRNGAASLWDERVVQHDLVHSASPNEQRAGSVRRSLIAVASAFDDESHAMLERKVNGSGNVVCVPCGDGVHAG